MQDVAPDLVAPASLDVLALELASLLLLLLERPLEQPGLEDLDGHLLVLGLAPLVLALGDDAGLEVGQADGRVGLVDVLATGTLGAERVDPDVVPVELDLDVVVGLGQDLDQGERRLAPILRVERADPDEAMDAALGTQPAVGPPAVDRDGHALEAGLLAFLLVEDLGREAVALRPAQVHAQEHLGPVGRFGAAGAGADRQERRALVVLAREQQRGPLAPEVASRAPRRRGRARPRARRRVIRRAARGRPGGRRRGVTRSRQVLDLGAQAVGLAQDLLGGAAVVPEPGCLGQCLRSRRRVRPWPRGQRCPEVDRIRSARSRTADAST